MDQTMSANECADRLLELVRQPWLLLPELVWTSTKEGRKVVREECDQYTVWRGYGQWRWHCPSVDGTSYYVCNSLEAGKLKCREHQVDLVKKMFTVSGQQ